MSTSRSSPRPRRLEPKVVVRRWSPHKSDRYGQRPRLIVLHSTEGHNRPGDADLEALGGWFANPASKVSSHVATDADGLSARFVDDGESAWTQASYNRVSLSIEMIGFASQDEWAEAQYWETARWLARWSKRHGVPLQRGRVLGGRIVRAGVVTHRQLGALGGGHVDPGRGFSVRKVIRRARAIRAASR